MGMWKSLSRRCASAATTYLEKRILETKVQMQSTDKKKVRKNPRLKFMKKNRKFDVKIELKLCQRLRNRQTRNFIICSLLHTINT